MNVWLHRLMHTVTANMMTISPQDRNVVLLKEKLSITYTPTPIPSKGSLAKVTFVT